MTLHPAAVLRAISNPRVITFLVLEVFIVAWLVLLMATLTAFRGIIDGLVHMLSYRSPYC